MASTNVVLPWSTWATMATFLMSSRFCMGATTIGQVRPLSCGSPGCLLKREGGRLRPGQGASEGGHAVGQRELIHFDLDQVAGVGPPAHDATGRERGRGPHRL